MIDKHYPNRHDQGDHAPISRKRLAANSASEFRQSVRSVIESVVGDRRLSMEDVVSARQMVFKKLGLPTPDAYEHAWTEVGLGSQTKSDYIATVDRVMGDSVVASELDRSVAASIEFAQFLASRLARKGLRIWRAESGEKGIVQSWTLDRGSAVNFGEETGKAFKLLSKKLSAKEVVNVPPFVGLFTGGGYNDEFEVLLYVGRVDKALEYKSSDLMDEFLDSVIYDEPVAEWDIPATREDPDDEGWIEKALRDAIDTVSKHLPTKHNQKTHAGGRRAAISERGKIGVSEGVQAKVSSKALTSEEHDHIRAEVGGWEGKRKDIAEEALSYFRDYGIPAELYYQGKELIGIASFRKESVSTKDLADEDHVFPKEVENERFLRVSELATARKGYGAKIMRSIFDEAKAQGVGVQLDALPSARSFYLTIGMTELSSGGSFYITAGGRLKVKSEVVSEEDYTEPEEGGFVGLAGTVDRSKLRLVEEKALRDAIDAVSKHLPMQHDQESHAGEGSRSVGLSDEDKAYWRQRYIDHGPHGKEEVEKDLKTFQRRLDRAQHDLDNIQKELERKTDKKEITKWKMLKTIATKDRDAYQHIVASQQYRLKLEDEPVVNWDTAETREDPDDDDVFEKALREAIEAVSKHLPTRHNQKTHAHDATRKDDLNEVIRVLGGKGKSEYPVLFAKTKDGVKVYTVTLLGATHQDVASKIKDAASTKVVLGSIGAGSLTLYSTQSLENVKSGDIPRSVGSAFVDVFRWAKNVGLPGSTIVRYYGGTGDQTMNLEEFKSLTVSQLVELVEKAGTVEGAKKAWLIRRRRQIEDLRARAVATRDAKMLARANAMAQSMARLEQASLVVMHLPTKHDQLTHGHGGKVIPPDYILKDVVARLPEHLQDVKVVWGGKRATAFDRDSYYDNVTKTVYFDPKAFSGTISSTSGDMNGDRVQSEEAAGPGPHDPRFGKVVPNVGAHLLQQTIRHELGHHVWYSMSDGQRQSAEKILARADKIKTPTIYRYQDYYEERAGEMGHRPPGYDARVRHEQFAEAVRWKQEKNPRWEKDVPLALRRLIDDAWSGKVSKSEPYTVEPVSKAESDILLNIAENGAHLDDVFWEQFKVEINRLVHRGYAYFTDTSGGGPGYTNRTVTLTQKGVDELAMWRRETGGRLQSLVANILGGMK